MSKKKEKAAIYGILQYTPHGDLVVSERPMFACVTREGMMWFAERVVIPNDMIDAFQQKSFQHEYGEYGWRFVTTTVDHQYWYTVPESVIDIAEMELADHSGKTRTAILVECAIIGQRQVAAHARSLV